MLVRMHYVRTFVLLPAAQAAVNGGRRVALRIVARLGDPVIALFNVIAPAGGDPHDRRHYESHRQRDQRRERRQRFAQQAEEGANRQACCEGKATTPTGLTL